MNKDKKSLPHQNASIDEKNQQHVLTDLTGKRHFLFAGKDGLTEQWIALIRHDECEERSSNYHYYFKWNGEKYVRRIMSIGEVPYEELARVYSANTSKDGLSLLIEEDEREIFHRKFREAMQSLTPEQKQLIYKRVKLKMSDMEIARQEGVSAAAIHYRWKRLRKRMKIFFEYL